MHSDLNFSNYSSCKEDHKRERVVSAALTLIAARLHGGKGGAAPHHRDLEYNPVKQYADWIEEALKISNGKSNPLPADE